MDKILLENVSKKYGKQVIFSGVNLSVQTGDSLAIVGYNGSGKSTLLQLIAGFVSPSSGIINHIVHNENIIDEKKYQFISYASPYLDLIEEFNTKESIEFYSKFKFFRKDINPELIPEMAELSHARNKPVKFFSSGMKQRLKLILAFLTDVPFLLLDEPVANLDKPGIAWYRGMIELYSTEKVLIVSSNEVDDEMDFCKKVIRIEDYKALIQ